MRLRVLSRASALARIQALLVERAIAARHPDVEVERIVRASEGDREPDQPLTAFRDTGAFTSDLSAALAAGDADVVVHSWKDLPVEPHPDTDIVGSLERADPRDVLVVRPEARDRRPAALTVLTSSPRRAWMLGASLPGLLPWRVDRVDAVPVRGNVPTRLRRLREGRGDALVVAKAALDRLLTAPAPFDDAARTVRAGLEGCAWCVLPIRSFPTAPAQGALALEVSRARPEVGRRLREVVDSATAADVALERAVLAEFGGGCHLALGATVITRPFGRVTSVRASIGGEIVRRWELCRDQALTPRARPDRIWPRAGEPRRVDRDRLTDASPASPGSADLWVARAEALPDSWHGTDGRILPAHARAGRLVWTAGERTWRALAGRGVWVHGCADGLGEALPEAAEPLAGRSVRWLRLTHREAAALDPGALATYVVRRHFPPDLADRTHFFWTSGSEFLEAIARWPSIRSGFHASGPGRTADVVRSALGDVPAVSVWLDVDHWRRSVSS